MSALHRYQWSLSWCVYIAYLASVAQYLEAVVR